MEEKSPMNAHYVFKETEGTNKERRLNNSEL